MGDMETEPERLTSVLAINMIGREWTEANLKKYAPWILGCGPWVPEPDELHS